MTGNLVFNMTLDILEGCRYSCLDCSVDKDLVIRDIPSEDVDELINLASEMKLVYGAEMFEFAIGPTDFITSKNGMGIFDHPLVEGLIKQFDSVSIALSMLSDIGLQDLGKSLDEHLGTSGKLRVAIPMAIKNTYNDKFLSAVRRRIDLLKSSMSECEFYRVYSTVIMTGESLAMLSSDSIQHMIDLDLGVWQTPEWTFGHSRARFDDILTHQQFIRDYRNWSTIMMDHYGSSKHSSVVPNEKDGVEVTYRNGKLYYLPYLVEKFHWWHEDLEIPKPWTAEAVFAFKDSIIMENMIDMKHSVDCEGCPHSVNCNTGDVKTVMRMLGETKCLPGIRESEVLWK